MTSSAAGRVQSGPWSQRADAVESAVAHRNVRRLWLLPGTRMGRVVWPADVPAAAFVSWRCGWQIQLIQCAVDAAARSPSPQRRRSLARLIRAPRIRGFVERRPPISESSIAAGLALERAARLCGVRPGGTVPGAVGPGGSGGATLRASIDPGTGGLPGGAGDEAGPDVGSDPALDAAAGLLLARLGDVETAAVLADGIHERRSDAATGLVASPEPLDEVRYPAHYQGLVLGMETELARRTGRPRHAQRVRRLVVGVEDGLCADGVLRGAGGGDAGLHAGILARHLAFVARELPERSAEDASARGEAARVVITCAEAAWRNRLEIDSEPLFGPDWASPATVPSAMYRPEDPDAHVPERDLSVQLSGWMLMEAAAQAHTVV